MEAIKKRLEKLTRDVLDCAEPGGDEGKALVAELSMLQSLSTCWRTYETLPVAVPTEVKKRLDALTKETLHLRRPVIDEIEGYTAEIKTVNAVLKTWAGFDKVEVVLDDSVKEDNRRSTKVWDEGVGTLTTDIRLTAKQQEALAILDDTYADKVLLLGGSGSGKSFVEAYKIIRDTLRYKAPCLVGRDKLVDLTQGMIDQIVPAILTAIAKSNGVDRWDTWLIDGLKFAKWTDKHTRLEFATGGYIRFAGLSARDLSESGSDKILSPSWLHVMLEEVSELEYEIVEKILTRLRHHANGVLNKLMLCENPPSINHWTYKRFYERRKEDGSNLSDDEIAQHAYLLMNPKDNVENLGETYIRNLSQMTGANRERFYEGRFQDSETGEILKRIVWSSEMPVGYEYDALIIYCDPTPLTTREHSVYADYKASVLVGLWQGISFLLDVRLVRGSTMDMLQNIKQLWDISPNKDKTSIYMEKKQVPSDFKQVWQTFSALTGWYVPINFDTRHFGDKKQAIEVFLQPEFDNDLVIFNSAFKDTERGRQTENQILKFSRKANKFVHDDVPDALMKAITKLKGRKMKTKMLGRSNVRFVQPAYVHKGG